MTREEMLSSLLDATPESSDLDVSEETAGEAAIPKSKTALELDDWSLRRGADVFANSERLRQTFDIKEGVVDDVKSEDAKWEAANLATADFHAAAFEPEPKLAKAPENERLAGYLKNLFETPEFKALHGETQLDELASEIATASFAEQWVALAATDEPGDKFKSDMQCLKAAGNALAGAKQEVGDLRDAQSALGIGGDGGGKSGIKSEDLAKVFKRVKGSHQLKRICELAGRYRRFAQAQQRKKVLHGRDDVVGVVMDGDIGRLLPHELVMLAECPNDTNGDGDCHLCAHTGGCQQNLLELDIFRRIIERQAMCREYRGIESKARGPIVVVVDESGSMYGEKIYTAKAMALALAWVARHQKRWYTLVGFSGGTGGAFCVCPPGGVPNYIDFEEENAKWQLSHDGLMEWLEHFYGNGTQMDVPLDMLPRQWNLIGAPTGKTDVICITDGIVNIPTKLRDSFLAWKAKEQVKMITLVLEAGSRGAGDIGQVSDRVHFVRSLSLDEAGVGEALGV